MAVVAMWKCDRDNSMFENRKDADNYDKMLELAETFSTFLLQQSGEISEADAENIGLLLAKNKDSLVAACKGNAQPLLDAGAGEEPESATVMPLPAKAKAKA
jgi:hypothetical protein